MRSNAGEEHDPERAGAYCYGRTKSKHLADGGTIQRKVDPANWICLMREAHPGYSTWEQFEQNQRQVLRNVTALVAERQSPPREGPALLQGLVVCGRCGHRTALERSRLTA